VPAAALGAFLGAVVYELTRVYAAANLADAWQLILGLVLMLVILFAPGEDLGHRRGPAEAEECRMSVLLSAQDCGWPSAA
jgi:ABC-type branched-subunit amino acid transport system permease subunit